MSLETSLLILRFYLKIVHTIPQSEIFINLVHSENPFIQR